MSQPKNIKTVIVSAIAICLLAAGGLSFAVYHFSKKAQKNLVKLNKEQERLQNLKIEIERTRLSIEQLRKEQEDFKKTLFDERDVPAFLDRISTSAAKAQVRVVEMKTQQFSEVKIPKEMQDINAQVSRIKFVDDKAAKALEEQKSLNEMLTLAAMPIRIKIEGNFEAIVNFLNSIENYSQLLTVSNVEISRKDYPQLSCEFNLRIYSLKKLKDFRL